MLVPVEVSSLTLDSQVSSPVVILSEIGGRRTLSILVGHLEAGAIAIKTLNANSDKPLTIDCVKLAIEQLGGELTKTVICDYVDNAFVARLYIKSGSTMKVIECRACDGIALAMRCSGDIYVEESVFDKSGQSLFLTEAHQIRNTITSMDTVDFGRYYLE
ncbi:MAG: hypothetical protein GF401_17690 [Chitinivibrionales bacterium]|nr:hypothetical protein [Chitinivibrionales bacterium]